MAESKRTFQSAKMDKDIDDRLLPAGTYRDALNVSVEFSEDGNVGALENLKGNELIIGQNIIGLSAVSNPNAKVIGSVAHPEESKIYYFVTGDNSDGIFEYDVINNAVSTIIIDSSTPPPTPVELEFAFSDALATASVAVNGAITVSCSRGEITSLTEDFDETVSTNTVRNISVRVLVPQEYSNAGDYVYGDLTATQTAIAAPPADSIIILEPTNLGETTVTLNAKYTQDAAGITDIGFYYIKNTGGSETISSYSNKFVITRLVGNGANISSGPPNWSDPFDTVAPSDITVIDGNGSTVSSSNYTYERYSGPQPSTVQFNGDYTAVLPVTVAQTSTLTTVTDALSKASIYGSGTQVSLSSNITSPFKTDVTGLDSNSEYAALAYVTNASGTTYSDVLNFKTKEVLITYNQLPDDRIFIFPTPGDALEEGYLYPGYGEFEKADGNFYLATIASHSSGLYANYENLSTGVTLSNTGPATLTFTDINTQFAKTYSASTNPTTDGIYTITASKSGLTSGTTQIVKGNPSNARYKSTFTLNFAKTGTGVVPFVAVFDHSSATALHWNDGTISPSAVFSIGPFEQGQKGVIMIPLSTDNTVVHTGGGTTANFNNGVFDPTNIDVSITGKTEGVDYDYYIATEAMSIWGSGALDNSIPAVIVEADPYVLNGGTNNVTHTLNITYNY